jgi:hypothetical protein
MKINITITHNDGTNEPWVEDYDKPQVKTIDDANEFAVALIQQFNNTLRPGEKSRKVLFVEIAGESGPPDHDWSKMNLVTVMDPRLGFYDILQCTRCGITAKRFGLDRILIDRKFRAKKFQKCKK